MSTEVKKRLFLEKNDSIVQCENNLVSLKTENGDSYDMLEPRRLFPVSRLDSYITLLDRDGKEKAVIRSYDELDEASAAVVKASINDYYLVPHITEILSVTEKSGILVWKVKTNRGIKQFDIRNRNHDIRVYKDGKIRVRDSDDNRYVIDDYKKLDANSRRFLASDI